MGLSKDKPCRQASTFVKNFPLPLVLQHHPALADTAVTTRGQDQVWRIGQKVTFLALDWLAPRRSLLSPPKLWS
ncbi:MAG: hypothetical protein CTY16_09255 [Methylobacter sp.]|nr:MAG: hypothetical protein CTY16_09255 [Methylobacter sp.]